MLPTTRSTVHLHYARTLSATTKGPGGVALAGCSPPEPHHGRSAHPRLDPRPQPLSVGVVPAVHRQGPRNDGAGRAREAAGHGCALRSTAAIRPDAPPVLRVRHDGRPGRAQRIGGWTARRPRPLRPPSFVGGGHGAVRADGRREPGIPVVRVRVILIPVGDHPDEEQVDQVHSGVRSVITG
jgi:hypothetical protein